MKKLIMLFLLFTVSCAPTKYKQFYFGDTVKITSGQFSGCLGIIKNDPGTDFAAVNLDITCNVGEDTYRLNRAISKESISTIPSLKND